MNRNTAWLVLGKYQAVASLNAPNEPGHTRRLDELVVLHIAHSYACQK